MRFRTLGSLGIAAALATTAACTDNSGLNAQLSGRYDLLAVNGASLPYTYNTGTQTITIQRDVYTLNSNGTYTEFIDETVSNGYSSGPTTDTESGLWSESGGMVTFNAQSSTVAATPYQYTAYVSSGGAFGGNTLTFTNSGVQWVYGHE